MFRCGVGTLAADLGCSPSHISNLAYRFAEWERYHQTVTDWEVTEYPRLY